MRVQLVKSAALEATRMQDAQQARHPEDEAAMQRLLLQHAKHSQHGYGVAAHHEAMAHTENLVIILGSI